MKEFFRPTWGKLILPLIFVFILISLLSIFIPTDNFFIINFFALVFVVVFILGIPFRPILERLDLWETGPMYFDMAPGPSLPVLFLIPIFYTIVSYLISCLVVYIIKKLRKRGEEDIAAKAGVTQRPRNIWLMIIIVVLAAVIFVAGVYLWQKSHPEEVLTVSEEEEEKEEAKEETEKLINETLLECEEITDSSRKDGCFFDIAVKTKDIGICEKITSSTEKETCYLSVAPIIKDSSLCEKITASSGKDLCYWNVALATKDASLCEKIKIIDHKDRCYFSVALATKDTSLCEEITNRDKKDSCYTEVSQKK